MNNIKKITIALISILIIIPLMGIGYVYFKLNSMYDKEEAKQINTTIEESEKNKKNNAETQVHGILSDDMFDIIKYDKKNRMFMPKMWLTGGV